MSCKPTIYLSGPMGGLTAEEAVMWRAEVERQLPEVQCLSPMRGVQVNGRMNPVQQDMGGVLHRVDSQQLALARDYLDVQRSDLIVVNLLGAKRVSIGTVMEIAWAYAMQKPVILAMEDPTVGNVHEHCLVNQSISVRVQTLDELVAVTRSMLLP